MTEHLTQKQFEDYRLHRLGVAELLPVFDHISECEACRRRVEDATGGDAAFLALRSEVFGDAAENYAAHAGRAHLSAEQTYGYVDQSLPGGELQLIADHLDSCAQCALAVDDLRAFGERVAPSLDREYHPALVDRPTESWWGRAAVSLSSLFRPSPIPIFGAALAVLTLTATSWLMWRALIARDSNQEIVVSPANPSPVVAPMPTPVIAPPADEPPPAAAIVARLNDGENQLTLDREGNLSGAENLPPAYRQLIKNALADRRIEKSPQLEGLVRPSSSLMGAEQEASEFSVIEPIGRVLVTARPTFRWSPVKGATSYVVEIYDDQFNLVTVSSPLVDNSWAVPRSLARGEVYAWQVKAVIDGREFTAPRPPAPQARFRVLDRAKANELAKAKRAYASSHLTLGLLYAKAGLLPKAERELRALRKANPDSAIARDLLDRLRSLRRRSERRSG